MISTQARAETYDPSDAAACLALAAAREPAYAAALAILHPVGDAMDFPRLLDAWRLNAFESGLYPRRALFNDARDPSCAQLVVVDEHLGPLAEVWTCRAVAKGDALTLSYVQPAEATAAKRHAYTAVWNSHLQPDFNVRRFRRERFCHRFVPKSAESTFDPQTGG